MILPNNNSPKAKNCSFVIFSFRTGQAKIATQINKVLWINEAFTAEVRLKPLKNSKNGKLQPIKPINANLPQSLADNFFNLDKIIGDKITNDKIKATTTFFKVVY